MERFSLDALPAQPWKNGGGTTREIAAMPPDAGTSGFAWRVSVAEIARPGPFSAFPGVDRQIVLLAGEGVRLRGP
ncbi:MAG TPA: HutD family protein, partial [Polyangiaceae bacterium]|nr:HutD family protein [Polyangiaceae bacterium]